MTLSENLFFDLLRSGLWGKTPEMGALEVSGSDWKKVYKLSMEQTVAGLITDGAALCPSGFVPRDMSMRLMSLLVSVERRNAVVNTTLSRVVSLFDEAGISVILVKGQAVAQCYIHPQGRMPGDIDLIVQPEQYESAKTALASISEKFESEDSDKMHFGAFIGDLEVELHGTVHTSLGNKVNDVLDYAQAELFRSGGCRAWECCGVQVRVPSIDFDALFIFAHLLQHFYCGGLGLRQLCDWARVLHTHCGRIDVPLLERRLSDMGLMTEWKAFVAFLVKYLALPPDEAPLYEPRYEAKADRLWGFMEKVGNFGKKRQRRDRRNDPYLIRKMESFFINSGDFFRHARIFPLDSIKFFWNYFITGTKTVIKGA